MKIPSFVKEQSKRVSTSCPTDPPKSQWITVARKWRKKFSKNDPDIDLSSVKSDRSSSMSNSTSSSSQSSRWYDSESSSDDDSSNTSSCNESSMEGRKSSVKRKNKKKSKQQLRKERKKQKRRGRKVLLVPMQSDFLHYLMKFVSLNLQ